jgi:hypothetical protein
MFRVIITIGAIALLAVTVRANNVVINMYAEPPAGGGMLYQPGESARIGV